MQFGIMLRGQFPQDDPIEARFHDLLEQSRLIEQLGYDSLTKGSHYSTQPLQDFQQIPFLCRIAGETTRVRLNTGVLLLPLHKPLDIAEQLATLDIMSGGRLIFGCGVGYREVEFKAFGTTRSQRGPRFEENLRAILALWQEQPVTMQGSHFELDGASSSVRPLQRPHPPIWIGASADAAIRRAAAMGTCWYVGPNDRLGAISEQLATYEHALGEAGRDRPSEFPIRREVFVAKSKAEAIRIAREPIETKYKAYYSWGFGRSRAAAKDELGQSFDDLIKDRFVLGSAEEVADELNKFHSVLGVNHFVMSMHWPGLAPEYAIESMQRFATDVMPILRSN